MENINKEQFRKLLEEFFEWTSSQERPRSSWFSSLETWAGMKFNEHYDKDYKK